MLADDSVREVNCSSIDRDRAENSHTGESVRYSPTKIYEVGIVRRNDKLRP